VEAVTDTEVVVEAAVEDLEMVSPVAKAATAETDMS
jgi:hypothetical protein